MADDVTVYFAYGSNMDRDQMARRGVGFDLLGLGVLEGFRLDFTAHSDRWGGGVADVVEDPGRSVEGILYRVRAGMESLDRYEGVERDFYRRRTVKVRSDGGPMDAVIYEVCDKQRTIPPSRSYMAALLRGGDIGLTPEYVEFLKAVRTVE